MEKDGKLWFGTPDGKAQMVWQTFTRWKMMEKLKATNIHDR
jgi:hypothetical protein